MDSPVFLQWQQWESRVRDWLDQPDNDLDLPDANLIDRLILTVLTVKYQVLYDDLDKQAGSADAKKDVERLSTIRLSKTKPADIEETNANHREKEEVFDIITGRSVSLEQVGNETSSDWQEFSQLCEWHGAIFLRRFAYSLARFVSELVSSTPAYQEIMHKPVTKSSVEKINNHVYEVKNDGNVFISVDMKSANFSMLQYIHAIDSHTYPTCADFLAVFVGTRPLITQSKMLRQRVLGSLPRYTRLETLWTQYTADVYRKILCRCLDTKEIDAKCVSLTGDEVVFQLNASIETEEAIDLVQYMQSCLNEESPLVKFVAQAYRLRFFHWRNRHRCFARMFLSDSHKFDLKCVPQKDQNYDQACEDFRQFAGL